MKKSKAEYIKYRVKRADEAFLSAIILAQAESWNACISQLYYASFYIVSALLLDIDIQPKTHKGVKISFLNHFVKSGLVKKKFGVLYSNLHDWRSESDYADFIDFDKEHILSLLPESENFIKEIKSKIKYYE
ncbi:MAG: HEPN domain-containing protein [Bacteroidales bacterium]